MICLDPQCGGHGPQSMPFVQENGPKDFLVVSLLIEILGAVE